MKISKLLTAVVIVLSLSALSFNAAFAGPGPGSPSAINKAKVSHLDNVSYANVGGLWTLTENKVINKNKSVENFYGTISTYDATALLAGTYTSDALGYFYINGTPYYWTSDFNSTLVATSITFTVTDNLDGTATISGTATY